MELAVDVGGGRVGEFGPCAAAVRQPGGVDAQQMRVFGQQSGQLASQAEVKAMVGVWGARLAGEPRAGYVGHRRRQCGVQRAGVDGDDHSRGRYASLWERSVPNPTCDVPVDGAGDVLCVRLWGIEMGVKFRRRPRPGAGRVKPCGGQCMTGGKGRTVGGVGPSCSCRSGGAPGCPARASRRHPVEAWPLGLCALAPA